MPQDAGALLKLAEEIESGEGLLLIWGDRRKQLGIKATAQVIAALRQAASQGSVIENLQAEIVELRKELNEWRFPVASQGSAGGEAAIIERCARAVELQDVEDAQYLAGVLRALSPPVKTGGGE